jgi:hypothetical protein
MAVYMYFRQPKWLGAETPAWKLPGGLEVGVQTMVNANLLLPYIPNFSLPIKGTIKLKQSHYTPWRRLGE